MAKGKDSLLKLFQNGKLREVMRVADWLHKTEGLYLDVYIDKKSLYDGLPIFYFKSKPLTLAEGFLLTEFSD